MLYREQQVRVSIFLKIKKNNAKEWQMYKYHIVHFAILVVPELFSISIFYRAMHFSAKRGIAIACRLSVCPSVCL